MPAERVPLGVHLEAMSPEGERDERFREVWEHSRRLWTHRLTIERVDELDAKLAEWLRQSWAAYSKPPADR